MECPSCRRENDESASLCDGCGIPLAAVCVRCDASLRAGARFCDACGAPVQGSGAEAARASMPRSFAAGRYDVRRFLGEGAKKRVYLANDTRLEREVAIAVIKTDGLDATGLARVHREARAMGRLGDHPYIATVYDVGDDGAQLYIVSQFMAGGSVEDVLRRAGEKRLPLDQVLRIGDQICRALEHAHARGVIHRDLKPGNVWLTEDGTAKLGDFGLALALDRSRMTVQGMMVGTVAYMPPEQALGRGPDVRSDLYGLGAMLYEMVTGRPPFLGDDAVAVISQHIKTPPVAPSWHNPDVPRALEALILRLLAKAPEDRPKTAAVVRQALEAIVPTAATHADRAAEQRDANPLDRLAGGVFVGREREMDELRAGLEEALSGRGRLLLLVGEPGIGKTRTADELATYARLRNVQVLWGRCYEGEGAPAYWPWVQAIRAYVHEREPKALLSEMGSGASEIAQVVSEVRERLPGLPAPQRLDPEQARFRLFDSITTFLRNASNGQPLALLLDDLHWADKPSLLLLQFIARELRGSRLLVVGTYRDVELGRQHPLSQTLGELAREQLSERILLRGLVKQDVERFIEVTAGLKPPPALVEAVYRETEGNPFFVNEVVRLLVSDGRMEQSDRVTSWSVGIPQSVREVVGRRLDRLSTECNRVLTVAAVLGREFRLDALVGVTGLTEDRVMEVLDEAVGARVILELPRSVGRYTFSHGLVRETLYEELKTTRRVRLHRQVAEVLEGLYGAHPEPHLAELAYHFIEASQGGDVGKAVDYARRAGARAAELLAYEEAAGHYERALQVLELQETADPAARCDLLLALGGARMGAGEVAQARKTFLHAAEIARRARLPERLASAALGLGAGLQGFWGQAAGLVDEPVVALLEETLEQLPEKDNALRALVLGRLAVALYWSNSAERRGLIASLGSQAVAMAERVGDPNVQLMCIASRRFAEWGPENAEGRLAAATEVVRLADEVGNREMSLLGHAFRLADLLEVGRATAVDEEIAAFTRLAEELRQPRYLWWATLYRAMRVLLVGDFAEGERLAGEAVAIGQRAQGSDAAQAFGVHMFTIRRELGGLEDLVAATEALSAEHQAMPSWRCGLVLLLADGGRVPAAQRELADLAARGFTDLPRDITWLVSMALLAETAALLGDRACAAVLYDLLAPYAERCVVFGYGLACWGSVSRHLGLLATTLSRWEEATGHFERALIVNRGMGARPWVAHVEHDYAVMLLARAAAGDRERAFDLVTRALDTAQELGMKRLVDSALALKLGAQGVARDVTMSIEAVASLVQKERPDLRPHAAPDGTVTILFTDVVDATLPTDPVGDRRTREIVQTHNRFVREQIREHGGFEVKSHADGFMVAFGSGRRALRCAIALQRGVAAHSARYAGTPLRVRVGLHTGEAIGGADDSFGKVVILAARIAGQAKGGEILVSSLLKELAESGGDVRFGPRREIELNGLAGVHGVHAVTWSDASD